mmetsp:Transcript_19588/g.34922  ORF Transcript_19588/g.34922 Transcript_19588/m.34922 type:complete len:540 (+) Transcript_19588:49-1668(+)
MMALMFGVLVFGLVGGEVQSSPRIPNPNSARAWISAWRQRSRATHTSTDTASVHTSTTTNDRKKSSRNFNFEAVGSRSTNDMKAAVAMDDISQAESPSQSNLETQKQTKPDPNPNSPNPNLGDSPSASDAITRTLNDWARDQIAQFDKTNPTLSFAAKTVAKWAEAGPEGLIRAVQNSLQDPPKWNEIESLLTPWLDPFPEPLQGVRSNYEVANEATGSQSRFLTISGIRLHYIQALPQNQTLDPEAPCIVLLHGFNGNTFSWRHVLQPLADRTGGRVIAFDRPPFGFSDRPTTWEGGLERNPYSGGFAVNLTTGLTRKLGLKNYILVGHSAGGPIAAAASGQSERCQGLVLVAPAMSLPPEDSNEGKWPMPPDNIGQILRIAYTSAIIRVPGVGISYIRAALQKQVEELERDGVPYETPYDEDRKAVAQGYIKPIESQNWDVGMLEHYKALINEGGLLAPGPTRSDLPDNILIIQGGEDPTVPPWVAQTYSKLQGGEKQGVQYVEYEDVGHLPMEQAPTRFVNDVARYCKDLMARVRT